MGADSGQPSGAQSGHSDNWPGWVLAFRASGADPRSVEHAEELDDVVQALATAKYALEAQDGPAAEAAIDSALAKARCLLSRARDEKLVRKRPAS